jgi:hypothetical protein
MSASVKANVIFNRPFFTCRCFVPVDVFLHSIFLVDIFLVFGILSQSVLFIFYVLSQSALFPFDVLSHSAFFLPTFCPSTFFTVGVFYFEVLSVNPLFP